MKKQGRQERKTDQYQLFETPEYIYRVFVTNMDGPVDVVGFYAQRAGAENLIKEANNDAGLAAHPSARWAINCVIQIAMLAYNLNCWLQLFNREEGVQSGGYATHDSGDGAVAVFIRGGQDWRHAGSSLVRYSDHYAEKGSLARLMDRLRSIAPKGGRFGPVLATPLRL